MQTKTWKGESVIDDVLHGFRTGVASDECDIIREIETRLNFISGGIGYSWIRTARKTLSAKQRTKACDHQFSHRLCCG